MAYKWEWSDHHISVRPGSPSSKYVGSQEAWTTHEFAWKYADPLGKYHNIFAGGAVIWAAKNHVKDGGEPLELLFWFMGFLDDHVNLLNDKKQRVATTGMVPINQTGLGLPMLQVSTAAGLWEELFQAEGSSGVCFMSSFVPGKKTRVVSVVQFFGGIYKLYR